MTPDDESVHDLYIHIPWDVLNEESPYKCPTTVTIQLTPKASQVGKSRRASPSLRSQGHKHPSSKKIHKELTLSRSVCASRQQLPSVRSSVMEKADDPDSTLSNFQDVIEMVAAANEHMTDFTDPSELPELRASPCLMHYRNNQNHYLPHHRQQGQQRLYVSNYHAGGSPSSPTSKRSGSSGRVESMEARVQMERSKLFQQDLQNGRNQVYSRPILPQAMTSKDFIKSWLQHGSEPTGHHFPEVITHKLTAQNVALRGIDKKQPLAPISRTVKPKKKKKSVQKSE